MKFIAVLDLGSQFAHLIGSKIRDLGSFCKIFPGEISAAKISQNCAGIILSGGPNSVFEKNCPKIDPKILQLKIPILGICFGHQLLAQNFGGKIFSGQREFGRSEFFLENSSPLLAEVPEKSIVWNNHGDSIKSLPKDFEKIGSTKNCQFSAVQNLKKKIFSVQFHPEVSHSQFGKKILENFLKICGVTGNFKISKIIPDLLQKIRKKIGKKNVFLFVSGGVDSAVAFALLSQAISEKKVLGLLVDTGLMRKNEISQVIDSLKKAGFSNLKIAKEKKTFLKNLQGVSDPEKKRAIIGKTFLDVQKKWIKKLKIDPENWLLGQGTIYPDHVETGGKNTAKIKTHHNRVPEIQKMITEGKIIEPLADFYKNEVRKIGQELKLPTEIISRQPFPGPGLGVRILCQKNPKIDDQLFYKIEEKIWKKYQIVGKVLPIQSVGVQGDDRSFAHPIVIFSAEINKKIWQMATEIPQNFLEINRVVFNISIKNQKIDPEKIKIFNSQKPEINEKRIKILQKADFLAHEILRNHPKVWEKVWQFPVVLVPVCTQENCESVILRPISSENAMTADVPIISLKILQEVAEKILKISEVSNVFLDLTSKPPGTIEWE